MAIPSPSNAAGGLGPGSAAPWQQCASALSRARTYVGARPSAASRLKRSSRVGAGRGWRGAPLPVECGE